VLFQQIRGAFAFRGFAPRGVLAIRTADANETLRLHRGSDNQAELVAKSVLTKSSANFVLAAHQRHRSSMGYMKDEVKRIIVSATPESGARRNVGKESTDELDSRRTSRQASEGVEETEG
jgi:hypothetical protein